jgi:hypothetical protein
VYRGINGSYHTQYYSGKDNENPANQIVGVFQTLKEVAKLGLAELKKGG